MNSYTVQPADSQPVTILRLTPTKTDGDAGEERTVPGDGGQEQERQDDTLPCLVVSRLEKIPLKDFSSEVRAGLDIERFVKEATILIDLEGAHIEHIVEKMLKAVFKSESADHTSKELAETDLRVQEAQKTLFLQASWMDYTYRRLAKTIKSVSLVDTEGLISDNSWLCTMCSLNGLVKRHVAIARLAHPVNLGRSSESVHLILLVVTPTKEKGTKSDIELGRTFATILAKPEFRQRLMMSESEADFKKLLQTHASHLGEEQRLSRRRSLRAKDFMTQAFKYDTSWPVCNGLRADLKRRLPHYGADFLDGVRDFASIRKVVSTVAFLYFACLLPCIAFGVLNETQTGGSITVQRVILSQCAGGLIFALFGGQPLVILLTTAPLALYTKVIYDLSQVHGVEFFPFFGWVGVFNALLLVIFAAVDASKVMRWSTRSTEEIFALFISIAFFVDAMKSIVKNFSLHYCSPDSVDANATAAVMTAVVNGTIEENPCHRETSILYLLLCLATVFVAIYLINFTTTPYLNHAKRVLMADFALPIAVLIISFVGSFLFREVKLETFTCQRQLDLTFVLASPLPWGAVLGAFGLAVPLSVLFFMDQNISAAMVNCPSNKLRKGSAYHWDLLTVAIINAALSCFGLPWVHGALPHSPLHVKALADMDERVDLGHHITQTVVRVRETRLTGAIASLLIGLSMLMCPQPLSLIPVPVLYGLFICMAISALFDNQFFERVLLLFTEQTAYPPSHYLRRVPQRRVHLFTLLQLIQLAILCGLGFNNVAYVKMGFPVVLLLQLPVRHLLLPKIVQEKYLDALDKPM